ncbi:PREDICTED: uncharacterized protein LOC109462744 [Branchiostoma belcheri]|uniref:Uncharacterized protein LOC109462744 n=1 Tax=Branchiostoma belcheri TaxID=7741 RepID=A0A6P4YD72_BRABE|nr:PREDICTED: uncharacterized protein LOC109462744 [Branchiostoma belcheri]
MEGVRVVCGVFVALLLVSNAVASFNPRYEEFSHAVALDRTLKDIPHRLLCHELCLKDASCASFQYNLTSGSCRVSSSPDGLEDRPDDDVDDSLHHLPLDGLLPAAPKSESACSSTPAACVPGQVCGDSCSHDGTTNCTCRSGTWDRQGCTHVDVGTWGEWGPWGDCSVSCGGGTKTRTRPCEDQYGGTSCVGTDKDVKLCKKKKCPEWTEWSDWTKCTRCGRSRTRTRTCPVPGHCPGKGKEKTACRTSRECSTLVRLQRGKFVTDGWVEVWDQLNGYWRPLCGEWNQQNGRVACRHLGFKDVEVNTAHGVMNLGCFTDDPGDRSPADIWNTTLNGPAMTSSSPQDCLAFCRLRGFKYVAIRSGNVCQCGRGYARNGELDLPVCSLPCAGDHSRACGSPESTQLNSVYTYALLGNTQYMPMDEVHEESGRTQIVGKPSAQAFGGAGLTDGVVGQALLLNGENQWAKTDLLDGTCLGSSSNCPQGFTLGMWIRLEERPEGTDRYYLSTGGHTRDSYGFNFYYDLTEGPSFWVSQNYSTDWCTTRFEMDIHVWIYLTFTWSPPCDVTIHVNSTKVQHRFSAMRLQKIEKDRYTALAIAAPNNKASVSGITGFFLLDELRFWDRKLSGREIHEVMMYDLRMSGDHYHPPPGSKVMKGKYKCTGEEPLLGMCEHEEDSSLADELCDTSNLAFVRCVPNSWLAGWLDWDYCDEDGKMRRTRKCYSPSPHYQGDCSDSPGPWEEVRDCDY